MINEKDKALLAAKGISEETLREQLAAFKAGFPYLQLDGAATVGNGILRPTPEEAQAALDAWDEYLGDNHQVVKFVPASGAASRMFKDLFAYLDEEEGHAESPFIKQFFENLPHAAFYADLDTACKRLYGADIQALTQAGRLHDIVSALLRAEGLGYGKLPKGLLKFHRYDDGARTPAEEHLVEGARYAKDAAGNVRVHFTVSPEHRALFQQLVDEKQAAIAKEYGARFDVSFSEQKPSTDTAAAGPRDLAARGTGRDGGLVKLVDIGVGNAARHLFLVDPAGVECRAQFMQVILEEAFLDAERFFLHPVHGFHGSGVLLLDVGHLLFDDTG